MLLSKHLNHALAACVLLLAALTTTTNAQAAERITTATGVRLRSAPQTAAEEVTKLGLGVVVRVLGRSESRERVGSAEDFWYNVAAPDGREGWVFGALTAPFDARRRAETYLKLANDRLKIEEQAYPDRAALFEFTERAAKEVTAPREAVAELELLRLLALHQTLGAIPFEKVNDPPYKTLTTERDALIVYSEPAGQWFVRADAVWALEKKYRGLPVAERIAWEASRLPLPGECEGYLPCTLNSVAMTEGEYLKLYPRGPHAGAALAAVTETLDAVLEDLKSANPVYEVPAEDRASFRQAIADLTLIVTRTSHTKTAPVLQKLNQLAAHFRR